MNKKWNKIKVQLLKLQLPQEDIDPFTLDELDRAYVFAYIDYIMHQSEEFPKKERTEMMLGMSGVSFEIDE